ncbi:MAG TPA: hypothetical protein VEV15_01255, partial [Flavisolibacter sp.]|nr:hypothetical protein [Flavisolibacter sp.]
GNKQKTVIAGKEYIQIATLQNGETLNKLFYQNNVENFVVKITAAKAADYTTYMGVVPVRYSSTGGAAKGQDIDESGRVISVKKKYELNGKLPFIEGNVQLNRGDGILPVTGAVITISFDKNKVKEQPQEPAVGNNGMNASAVNTLASASIPTLNAPVAGSGTNSSKTVSSVKQVINKTTNTTTAVMPVLTVPSFVVFNQYSAITDSLGNYRIDNLPVLNEGTYTVTCKVNTISDKQIKEVVPLQRNDSARADFQLNPEVVVVTGIVVDDKGEKLDNALVKWKSGGNPVMAENGLFTIKNIPGKDSLVFSRFGYVTKTIAVEVKKSGEKADTKNNTGGVVNSLI